MAIRIRCFPTNDRVFFEQIHDLTRDVSWADAQHSATVDEVLERVRVHYPACRISVRDGLAILTDDEPVWYAYRDGTPGAPKPGSVALKPQGVLATVLRRLRPGPVNASAAWSADPSVVSAVPAVEAMAIAEPALIAATESEPDPA